MSETQIVNQEKQWSRIVAKAWDDGEFKSRLISDPVAVLAENGLEVPAGTQVKVLEDTDTVRHFTLPPSPAADLVDEDLVRIAVADCWGCRRCRCGGCGRCGCGCRDCRSE